MSAPRKVAVVHHRVAEWLPVLREAEPRLEFRGWRPEELDRAEDAWLGEAEGLLAWKFPAGFLPRLPRLAWLQALGAGVDHLVAHPELPAQVPLTRADGRFGFWMARYVAYHLLEEAQRGAACREAQAARTWRPELLPEDLAGRRAVVVGVGLIGRQICRALRELGLAVHGVVRSPRPDPEFPLHGTAELPGLLPETRVLVLAAPLTPGTRGLLDARLLARGHGGLTLVNVGRGAQVVEADLLEALDAGRLGRAVLDVFPEEPLPSGSPLWTHPKVTVTPHHSGPSTPKDMVPELRENLARFAEGRPVEGALDRARGY